MSDPSGLRQRLRAAEERRSRKLQRLVAERDGLIRGTLGVRARVCGHVNCRCAQGELHESKYLSAAVEGRTRQVHVLRAPVQAPPYAAVLAVP
jgi:hypothetical protein